MLASVIIPNKNRIEPLVRAVTSVINSMNSHLCEILIVDDCSDIKPTIKILREQDRIIYLEKSVGAAVARNTGIREARGKVIFLLDSDDYFVDRDFVRDSEFAIANNCLCYSRISSQNYESSYPNRIDSKFFFEYIFSKYKYIAQTSSLYFPKSNDSLFDESLPRHQDWDLIYYSFLRREIEVIQGPGEIYFDRSDKNSISRKVDINKSLPWYKKLLTDKLISTDNKDYIEFNLLAQSQREYCWSNFVKKSLRYIISGKISVIGLCKIFYKRFFGR